MLHAAICHSLIALACPGAALQDADASMPPELSSVDADRSDRWGFSVTPYIWMISMDGELRVDDTTADVDLDFSDLVDDLNLGLMVHMEARKGRLGFYVDPVYSQIEVDGETPGGDVELTTNMLLVDFGLLYRVLEERSEERYSIADVSLGGRYFYLDNEIDFPVLADVDGSTDFVDLTVGGRYGMEWKQQFGFMLEGDIGGFDLGSSSEFAWNALGLGFWNVGKRGRILAGYRILDADRDKGGSTGVEMEFSGPVVGYEFRL